MEAKKSTISYIFWDVRVLHERELKVTSSYVLLLFLHVHKAYY